MVISDHHSVADNKSIFSKLCSGKKKKGQKNVRGRPRSTKLTRFTVKYESEHQKKSKLIAVVWHFGTTKNLTQEKKTITFRIHGAYATGKLLIETFLVKIKPVGTKKH